MGELNQATATTIIGRGLAALRFAPDDRDYAWHALLWSARALHRVSQGTTFLAVSRRDVEDLQIPWYDEGNRDIAGVLDAIDNAIAKGEAVIAKLQQVRTGLLYDLLTRGLNEGGDLRDAIAHPKDFKDSPLGPIPACWEVKSVAELLMPVSNAMRSGPFGSALLKQELRDVGVPLLGIDNVHVEEFVGSYTRFVDEQKYQELRRYAVRPRDIMITIMGTVGRCCVVPDDIPTALSSKHVWTITLDQSQYSPLVACWQINFAPWVLRHFRRDEQGGVMTAIRSETLRKLLLPVPSPAEMRFIENVVVDSTDRIRRESLNVSKLNLIRAGLAADLLSGRVRVPQSAVATEVLA